jgi:hypothetical protein
MMPRDNEHLRVYFLDRRRLGAGRFRYRVFHRSTELQMNDQQNNRGALFKNDKEGIISRPDYRGPARINGRDYYVSAWVNIDKTGRKKTYMALRFQEREPPQHAAPPEDPFAPLPRLTDRNTPDFDDQIPF